MTHFQELVIDLDNQKFLADTEMFTLLDQEQVAATGEKDRLFSSFFQKPQEGELTQRFLYHFDRDNFGQNHGFRDFPFNNPGRGCSLDRTALPKPENVTLRAGEFLRFLCLVSEVNAIVGFFLVSLRESLVGWLRTQARRSWGGLFQARGRQVGINQADRQNSEQAPRMTRLRFMYHVLPAENRFPGSSAG